MPEIANVVASETIAVEWGNAIRDRVIQRYADNSDRTTKSPTPSVGDLAFMADTGDVARFFAGAWHQLFPTGFVGHVAGSIPPGFLHANGAAVARSTYPELNAYLSAAGYPYGDGDGSLTFNLPDLRQRMILGVAATGTGSVLGATGGAINHTHTAPSHTHGVGTLATSSAGDHTHTMAHTHSTPNHTHSISSSGSHSHTTGGPSANSNVLQGEGLGTTSRPTSAHTHSISSSGSHTHSTTSGGGDTTGASSAANTGSGGSHTHAVTGTTAAGGNTPTAGNNPPYIALTPVIKT